MKKYKEKAQHLATNFGIGKGCCGGHAEVKQAEIPIKEASITFKLNGKEVTLNSGDVKPTLSLGRYIRDFANLKGTKLSCRQAGCGVCVVTAKVPDMATGSQKTISVNSCLAPVLNCNEWEITTVEGLGNETSPHPVQERLAAFNGTQCGYCSPGMVMQMNSLLEKNKGKATSQIEVENVLDGNICRCTGYRPILDAFKTFASNEECDIEDALVCKKACMGSRAIGKLASEEGDWYIPTSLSGLMQTLNQLPIGTSYRLVHGNTGRGVFDYDAKYGAYISLKNVPELTEFTKEPLTFGAGMTLTSLIDLFDEVSGNAGYKYCKTLADHIRKVAHPSVRNVGTVGGNLMLKHSYKEFPSDLFLILETAGATVVVKTLTNQEEEMSVLDFLNFDMDKKVLLKLKLPSYPSSVMLSYKTMQRSINTHAYVNGAIRMKLDANLTITEQPSLVFGGINESFVHASKTEALLVGKSLTDTAVLKEALEALKSEAIPDNNPALASPEYRSHLVQGLFYRFVLAALGDKASPEVRSGAYGVTRGFTSGLQTFETDASLFPVNQPVEKYEAKIQCTGEAIYTNDIPAGPEELHAAFVYSTVANCDLDIVDTSDAMALPGVVAYIDHNDIQGSNNAILDDSSIEEIFTSGKVYYAGQAIGLILAKSFEEAHEAARSVKVTYKNKKKPILSIREALEAKRELIYGESFKFGSATNKKSLKMVEGEFEVNTQYHFYMETQSVIVKPSEKGQLDIYAATQWQDNVQMMVSQALKTPVNLINVHTRRLGGAYGGKTRTTGHVAAAAAVAATKLKKPVRLVMDLRSNFEVLGRRHPFLAKYKAGVDSNGAIEFVDVTIISDSGFSTFEDTAGLALQFAKNCYKSASWDIKTATVMTNTASMTICRAPGTTPGFAMIENVIEHLAHDLGIDPLEFRLMNMVSESDPNPPEKALKAVEPNPLPEIVSNLKVTSNYNQRAREIAAFNAENRWKKRGLSMVPMLYLQENPGANFYFHLNIYRGDGTIAVSTGAVEMGQGINTKIIQTVAKELGVPMDSICMKPVDVLISPQNACSWGSWTTDCICSAAIIACGELKARLQKVQETMENPTWLELIQECYNRGVDLSVRHMGYSNTDVTVFYNIYSATVAEVELDVLTGEVNVRRVDIVEDTGTSINPTVDIGQVEGAFVMALGLWLTEQVRYNPDDGRLLTYDTWEYKPPSSKDIPQDFRVSFIKNKGTSSGVLSSKAVGEQSLLMGVSAIFALRRAIDSVKKDTEGTYPFYTLDGPATPEKLQLATGAVADHFYI